MKKYFILLLLSLFLLQGCDWLKGKRGSEGETGIAGITGPSGMPGKTGILNSNPTLKDLVGYQYLVDSVIFQTYVDKLDNQTWTGTIHSFSPPALNSIGPYFQMNINDSGGLAGYVNHSGKTIEKKNDPSDWRTHYIAEINSTVYKFQDVITIVVKITKVSSNDSISANLVSISK